MGSGATLYKQLIRELARHHKQASAAQAKVVRDTEKARSALAERTGKQSEVSAYNPKPFDVEVVKQQFKLHEVSEKDANEVVEFLTHQRQYKELLERYTVGPADTLDRVKMTARRVGLDAENL